VKSRYGLLVMDAFSVMAALCVICMAPWSECLEEVGRDTIGSEAMTKTAEKEDESKSMDMFESTCEAK
jgi:hypothetical protein